MWLRLLEDPKQIPMKTYRLAMRIANRYCMDEVQEAVTGVVKGILSTGGYTAAIERFVLISEHSAPFSDDEVMEEFSWICRQVTHPNEDELKPFGSHWDLISCVIDGGSRPCVAATRDTIRCSPCSVIQPIRYSCYAP